MTAAVLSHVTKIYPKRPPIAAVHDISLSLTRGERLGIVGPSGSGKSTLLNLMGGLDVPTAGSITVGDVDLGTLNERGRSLLRRSKVAYIFQAYHLLPALTCFDNVALPLHLQHVDRQTIDARVTRALADVRLTDRANHLPEELSGGERQRAAIARALVTEPSLLLADEPTGNLDSAAAHEVLALLSDIALTRNAALVLVTHNDDVAHQCDRIVRIHRGRLEERHAS